MSRYVPESFSLLRWTLLCAGAETIGMTAAAGATLVADRLFPVPRTADATSLAILLIVVGGLIEGGALGTFQSAGLRRWLPAFSSRKWIVVTTLVAGLGWASASAPSQFAQSDSVSEPPQAVVVLGGLGLGALMGAVLGAAQAVTLTGVVQHPWRWVWVSTIAWTPAMAIIFTGATTPDAGWRVSVTLGLAALTGALAGAALGLVSGAFWRVLHAHPGRSAR